jgi:ABC-type transport system involved in multi-copper enzyme maturation permease subunit
MLPLLGIFDLTLRELWAKKVIMGLFLVSTLVLLFVSFALNLDVVEGSLASFRLFGSEAETDMTLEDLVFAIESVVAGAAYWLGVLLALFSAAPLFTTLLDEGHIDLLLSKPISRPQLLAGHVAGVWGAMLVLVTYLLGGVWLLMSVKSGVWNPRFLLAILLVVALFAVMYGVVVLLGAWTESTALSLITTYGLIFVSLALAGVKQITPQLSSTGAAVFWTAYHTLPNFAEVTQTVGNLATGDPVTDWYPFVSSLLFGAVCYALGAWIFARRDF